MKDYYDITVIGAGINGVAISKNLANTGKKVLVIEKNHIASGASSHSSKLIHGGLRYLEQFEFFLVKESLQNQKYLLDTYPDLVKLRPFYLPIYKDSKRPLWLISLGLWIYSFFSKHGHHALKVSKDDFCKKFTAIKKDNLKAVFKYFDGKTDDRLLTCKVAKEAQDLGVDILENTQLEELYISDESIDIKTSNGCTKSNVLINATGAWIDEINDKFNLPSSYSIEKLSGIHIVIDKLLIPEPLILETESKRIFFIIPELTTTYIGTTERQEITNIDDIKVNSKDIEYLLYQSNKYLKTPLKTKDIKEVYIGTRPLIKSQKQTTMMSREYKLDLHKIGKNNILHIYGGKLTTFASLAKKTVDLLKKIEK